MPEAIEARLTFAQLQAVASPTRFSIVRTLRDRRATISEISASLQVAKSSTHAALEVLEQAGLVRRLEDERVWVYYELTPLGRCLALANPLRLVVYFALAVVAAAFGAALLAWDAARSAEAPWYIPPVGVPPDPQPPFYARPAIWACVALLLALALTVLAWRERARLRRARQLG